MFKFDVADKIAEMKGFYFPLFIHQVLCYNPRQNRRCKALHQPPKVKFFVA